MTCAASRPAERFDTGGRLAAADDVGAVHVVGGEVGQSAAALVFGLDPHRPPSRGPEAAAEAVTCLDTWFLISGEHVVVRAEWFVSQMRAYRSSARAALTSATCAAVNVRGRPLRGRSINPSIPLPQNRFRHLRAVSAVIARARAIPAFDCPAGAASTIRARYLPRQPRRLPQLHPSQRPPRWHPPKHSTAPAPSTSTTPPPGNPRRTNGRTH